MSGRQADRLDYPELGNALDEALADDPDDGLIVVLSMDGPTRSLVIGPSHVERIVEQLGARGWHITRASQ